MKIAHFSYSDTWGAYGAAYELHQCLQHMEVQSTFFVKNKTRNDESIIELCYEDTLDTKLKYAIDQVYFKKNHEDRVTISSFDGLGIEWNEEVMNQLAQYDLFHLHWISGLLSTEIIHKLITLGKPVIWTMHDFQPFTGGCHYPEICTKYQKNCDRCPQLVKNKFNITKEQLLDKKKAFSNNIHIIVASKWLKDIIQQSTVFNNSICKQIPIGVNMNDFSPMIKEEARKQLGFKKNDRILLMGAQSTKLRIKGYDSLKDMFEILKKDKWIQGLIERNLLKVVTFGATGEELSQLGISSIHMGVVRDRKLLREIYSAADVFFFPSIQETFGMTAVEAMACGTPVISYNVCAMREVIKNGVNGYKFEVGDYKGMAETTVAILKNCIIDRERCRKEVENEYALKTEAESVLQLYEEALEQKNTNPITYTRSKRNERLEYFVEVCKQELISEQESNQVLLKEILSPYHPEIISSLKKIRDLVEKEVIVEGKKVCIYGAGDLGLRVLTALEELKIPVVGFWDSDEKKWGSTLRGYSVTCPQKYKQEDNYIILIAVLQYSVIAEKLSKLGFTADSNFF